MAFVRATGTAILESAAQSFEAGLTIPHLIGEADEIKQIASDNGISLDGCHIHDTTGESEAIAHAIQLAHDGTIQGFVKGQLHTDVFMGGLVNRDAGMRTDSRMVHVFAMFPPDGGAPLMISDGAVNVAPNNDTRIAAALNVAELARAIEIERRKSPSYQRQRSQIASVPSSLEAAEIADACRTRIRQLIMKARSLLIWRSRHKLLPKRHDRITSRWLCQWLDCARYRLRQCAI